MMFLVQRVPYDVPCSEGTVRCSLFRGYRMMLLVQRVPYDISCSEGTV
jgi:hypothetical protein